MASRMDEVTRYGESPGESIDLDEIEDEIERKKIYKQRKEKKRVENLAIAYEKLAAKMASFHGGNERARDGRNGRRRSPSRLSVLASALAHIKILRQQTHMVASTPDSSDGESTFRISQILPTAVDRCSTSSSSRRQGSSSTESSQCQSSSESSSETTPTGLMPVYGSSDVLPSHIEQDRGNHMLSPWVPANNYIETEYCIENISILPSISNVTGGACSSSSYVYCTCCDDQYHWQNGYYEYPNYAT